jgi:hypothetical protein
VDVRVNDTITLVAAHLVARPCHNRRSRAALAEAKLLRKIIDANLSANPRTRRSCSAISATIPTRFDA